MGKRDCVVPSLLVLLLLCTAFADDYRTLVSILAVIAIAIAAFAAVIKIALHGVDLDLLGTLANVLVNLLRTHALPLAVEKNALGKVLVVGEVVCEKQIRRVVNRHIPQERLPRRTTLNVRECCVCDLMCKDKESLIVSQTLEEVLVERDVALCIDTGGRDAPLLSIDDGNLAVLCKQTPKGEEAVHTEHDALHPLAQFIDLLLSDEVCVCVGCRCGCRCGDVVLGFLRHAQTSLPFAGFGGRGLRPSPRPCGETYFLMPYFVSNFSCVSTHLWAADASHTACFT